MKLFGKIIIGLILVIGVVLFFYYPRLIIISGFSAKSVCSCTFIADRDFESITEKDNGFMPISLASSTIDKVKKSVTSSVFGLQKRTAYYHKGYGCVLDNDRDPTNNNIDFPAPIRQLALSNESSENEILLYPRTDSLSPKDINFDAPALEKAIDYFFGVDSDGESMKTRSVLVVYKDQIIGERYEEGCDASTPMLGWSMTKSIVNTLYGILVKEKNFDIHQQVDLPSWQKDNRKNITYHDLLQMNSGLEWEEDYNNISDVTNMLFNSYNVGEKLKGKPSIHNPQVHFNYSSGTSNLLSSLLKDQFSTEAEYHQFPYQYLFDKIGMNSMVMETDMAGNFIGSSYSFATARDWAKFGLLYLHDGKWNNERILPEGWAKYSSTPNGTSKGEYGAHFWLNAEGLMPNVPRDLFSANGFQGQRVYIIPSKDLVVIRTGYKSHEPEVYDHFLSGIISSLK